MQLDVIKEKKSPSSINRKPQKHIFPSIDRSGIDGRIKIVSHVNNSNNASNRRHQESPDNIDTRAPRHLLPPPCFLTAYHCFQMPLPASSVPLPLPFPAPVPHSSPLTILFSALLPSFPYLLLTFPFPLVSLPPQPFSPTSAPCPQPPSIFFPPKHPLFPSPVPFLPLLSFVPIPPSTLWLTSRFGSVVREGGGGGR